jgi:hypothetical protein
MPLENNETAGSVVTGSTYAGYPDVVGGVYYGSGNVGSLPAYVQSLRVDSSGSVYVTTSGSLPVSFEGAIETTPVVSNVAIETSFTASLTSQLLAPANSARAGITVFSDPSNNGYLYLRLFAPATTSSYSTVLWPGSYWEAPYGYLGTIYGVFTTTTGSCLITEYT